LLGYSGGDPGHWNFSPEWYGTQGGGWGHDPGQVVFARDSPFNGRVEVTAHSASLAGFESGGGAGANGATLRQEWRVLRFNGFTRQSVARVRVADGADAGEASRGLQQQRWWLESGQSLSAVPECLAQEYLKSMTSVMAALLGLHRLLPDMPSSPLAPGGGPRMLRVLCIGLGGGSLPNFLVHSFPFASVDAVEIDPAVVEAATLAMGLPARLPRMTLHTADAMDFVEAHVAAGKERYDVVCMDAFTGDDEVPSTLCTPRFAAALAQAMHPAHGSLLINFHSLAIGPIAAVFKEALWGGGGSGGGGRRGSDGGGSCFSVSTTKQQNVTLACSRGLDLPPTPAEAKERLKMVAAYVADTAGFPFPAGARACRNLQPC
jgi:hypothetical protein